MMKSSSERRIPLQVRAADASTEVFIADGRLRRIAKGVGEASVDVPPGIYKVRFRSGDEQRDELVEVSREDSEKVVSGALVRFRSAAPIADTATSREYHSEPAERMSRSEPMRIGQGSRLFLFARELHDGSEVDPWVGMSLHDLDGGRVAGFEDGGEMQSEPRYGALHLELDPGTYRLRVDTGPVGTYEMFVVTSAGWQTQVFMVCEDFDCAEGSVRRASLRDASVFMTRAGEGFDADDEQLRLAELARQGLASGRSVVRPRDLNDMLWAKYSNPMLGVYGAHHILMRSPINHDLVVEVMRNLTSLLGPHPDVLALHLRPGAPTPPGELGFPTPPMLRDSWELITRGSHRRHRLVPRGSPAERLADDLIGTGLWLLHRHSEALEASVETVSYAEAERLLHDAVIEVGERGVEAVARTVTDRAEPLSSLERSILAAIVRSASVDTSILKDIGPAAVRPPDELATSIGKLMKGIDAPTTSIARSASSLIRKLDMEGG